MELENTAPSYVLTIARNRKTSFLLEKLFYNYLLQNFLHSPL